jgi:hypothetical protein
MAAVRASTSRWSTACLNTVAAHNRPSGQRFRPGSRLSYCWKRSQCTLSARAKTHKQRHTSACLSTSFLGGGGGGGGGGARQHAHTRAHTLARARARTLARVGVWDCGATISQHSNGPCARARDACASACVHMRHMIEEMINHVRSIWSRHASEAWESCWCHGKWI